jgi:hypothetical protein
MEPEKNFIITNEQRTMLLGYLFARPYGEVAKGVAMLLALPEVPSSPPPVEPVKE